MSPQFETLPRQKALPDVGMSLSERPSKPNPRVLDPLIKRRQIYLLSQSLFQQVLVFAHYAPAPVGRTINVGTVVIGEIPSIQRGRRVYRDEPSHNLPRATDHPISMAPPAVAGAADDFSTVALASEAGSAARDNVESDL
jgi:hypothetical protein